MKIQDNGTMYQQLMALQQQVQQLMPDDWNAGSGGRKWW